MTDWKQNLAAIYAVTARQWLDSARGWRETAWKELELGNLGMAEFALGQARWAELQAEQDQRKASV